ncbi:hypothetical protein EYF80_008774 [Liparis tanakae]|uniref:Uncharacterized protein n=1 Tax=Liparis tanakae TaxID=230148 RepID=A0A4Z2IU56_9TELE|nr:hypothetical protein EYF80_008774 [Liparis tanakae]
MSGANSVVQPSSEVDSDVSSSITDGEGSRTQGHSSGKVCARFSVEEPPTERGPKFLVHTEVANTSGFRSDARTDGGNGKRCAAPDFIKHNTDHATGR